MSETNPTDLATRAPPVVRTATGSESPRWALTTLALVLGAICGVVLGAIAGVLTGLIPFVC